MNDPPPPSKTPSPENPFSTRWIRPGALPYLFPTPIDAAALVQVLGTHRWRGQIIGPHGSGKSTLLESLLPEIRRVGKQIVRVTLRSDRPGLDEDFSLDRLDGRTVLVVDGFEQLLAMRRLWLGVATRHREAGLLVTTHRRRFGLPVLWRTKVDLPLALRVIRRLAPDEQFITDEEIARQLADRRYDLRETLFGLYDLYREKTTGRAPPG